MILFSYHVFVLMKENKNDIGIICVAGDLIRILFRTQCDSVSYFEALWDTSLET